MTIIIRLRPGAGGNGRKIPVDSLQTGITITGLHMHIGSGTDLEHLSEVCDAMERAAAVVGRTLRTISAGGGLPVPYKSDESYVDLGKYLNICLMLFRTSLRICLGVRLTRPVASPRKAMVSLGASQIAFSSIPTGKA